MLIYNGVNDSMLFVSNDVLAIRYRSFRLYSREYRVAYSRIGTVV